jgi:hypothetical protein
MKRLAIFLFVLFSASFVAAQITFGGGSPPPKKDKPITSRTLIGLVTDKDDNPIPDAIVYLKDTKTLGIKSYVSQKDGSYRFNALSMNIDYEVYAQKADKKSATKKLSQFDSRGEPRLNLKIEQ